MAPQAILVSLNIFFSLVLFLLIKNMQDANNVIVAGVVKLFMKTPKLR